MTDHELVARIRRAIAAGIDAAGIEEFVGAHAWINSIRHPDVDTLRMVNLGADPDGVPPALADAAAVVYWGRPLESVNPRIVGVTWNDDGRPSLFFGVVYPP
ncbi:MAG TPA: hypothetical protein VHI13_22935 [Candidatus Kapabacteria bacterium]|nr:hypothetical protein [Candidatus Kapabacteria bacterium]